MKTKNLIIICSVLILCGILFWPTLYRYDKITIKRNTLPLRINRLTGYTECFLGSKWEPRNEQKNKIKSIQIPFEESFKITGNASLDRGTFSGKIYNGSDWNITKIKFRVKAIEKDGKVRWDREFVDLNNIAPFTTSSFFVSVTGDNEIGSFEWNINDVWGYKPKR